MHMFFKVTYLIEGMLPVGTRLTPKDRSCLDIHLLTALADVLSVRFHVSLLEISWESMHVLIIGQNRKSFSLEKVVVPDSNQRQGQRKIFLGRGVEKVLVNGMRTGVQLHPVVVANGQGNGGSNGTPERVASSDPVPESKHVVGINSKLGHSLGIGGKCSKMLGN